jgi:hypothetical protein
VGWLFSLVGLGGVYAFVADHVFTLAAIGLAVVGLYVRLAAPAIGKFTPGKDLAAVLWIMAAALGAGGQGWAWRAEYDRSAAIQAQLVEANRELAATHLIASRAAQRADAAEVERDQDNRKVRDYEIKLAALGDCGLTPDDVGGLLAIGRPAPLPPKRARWLGAGSRAKAALAEYRAGLVEANRRLIGWRDFYADVVREFGSGAR